MHQLDVARTARPAVRCARHGLFTGNHQFIGFANYATVLSSERFQDSLVHLAQYLTFGAVLQVILGTVLALTLYEYVGKSQF